MKIIRTSTIPLSLNVFCKDFLRDLHENEGYEVIAVSSPDKELKDVEIREGIKTYGVRMERHISPLNDLKSLWQLIKVFRKEKPDMVHSFTPKAGLLSMMAAWICRVPVRLHTFTGLVFPTTIGLKQKILILTDRITCACATHISPEGEGVKNDLIKYKITKKPLKVLGYGNVRGIDLDYYDPDLPEVREEASRIRSFILKNPQSPCGDGRGEINHFIFVFVGRLVRDKGINELVEAFSRLNKDFPNVKLLLVGPEERELDPLFPNTLREIERNPSINTVGMKDDVRPWLLAADALVFPSYREGFPNVVIEAGSMGLPSIVTDINGSREIIINGKNGIIIPSLQDQNQSLSDNLYNAMKDFIENPVLVKEMASDSRSLIASRFEQSFVRKCLKDFYKSILVHN